MRCPKCRADLTNRELICESALVGKQIFVAVLCGGTLLLEEIDSIIEAKDDVLMASCPVCSATWRTTRPTDRVSQGTVQATIDQADRDAL